MQSLRKLQFLALAALLKYPMHPYAIRQEIILLSGHMARPSHSALRKALDYLLAAGLIEVCRSNSNVWLVARRSVPYELTELGHKTLRRELSMYHEITIKSYGLLNQFDQ